jgi:glycosyltransferase involved in cell wall biosynthesis
VPVHYLRLGRTDPRQTIDLPALLHKESPDIVHTHLTLSCLLGRIAAVMVGVEAVVVHDHEADAEIFITPAPLLALKRLIEPYLPPRGVRYIVISHSALAYACQVRHLPESNLFLVPNGVDIAYLERGRVSSKAARAQFGLPVDAPLIGYAGRMAPEKGIDLLLEALSQLSGVHAAIAGQGPLANEMQAYARKLGVAERTHFLGHLDDIRPLLWACDVYVQPSRREAFGLAAAEASALGLPVVASRIGGLRDVVLDKVTGRLFQPGNVNELASILAFLVENVEYARILGFAGRSHIFQYFTIDAVLDRIDEIYWGILG